MKLLKSFAYVFFFLVSFIHYSWSQDNFSAPKHTILSSSDKELMAFYKPAAESGNAYSQYVIATIFEKYDINEAVKWYKKGAEQGYFLAQHKYGLMHWFGEGVNQNYQEGLRWLELSANQGYAVAQHDLGVLYLHGDGVKQNYQKAFAWFEEASKQNLDVALYNLGLMYVHGYGIEQDYKKALELFKKADERGLPNAPWNIALIYIHGLGTKKDNKEIMKWLHKAADKNDPQALYELGLAYERGYYGISQNLFLAKRWFSQACEKRMLLGCDAYKDLNQRGI